MYLLLDGEGQPARWPYDPVERLPLDRPDIELPEELTDEFLATLNVYPLEAGEAPTGSTTLAVIALPPALVDGVWANQWRTEAREPFPPPVAVTPLQMRRALRVMDLKDGIDAFLEQAGEEAQEAWEYAVEIRRDDALVIAAATALGKTTEELDDLFRLAATMTS